MAQSATTTIQDALPSVTTAILDRMSDPSPALAERSVSYLMEISPLMRGCAILDASGDVIAATGDAAAWKEPAERLISAVDATPVADGAATHAHVATEDGEAFLVREADYHAVAVFERFCLSSLVFFDLRAAIRDVRGEQGLRGPDANPVEGEG